MNARRRPSGETDGSLPPAASRRNPRPPARDGVDPEQVDTVAASEEERLRVRRPGGVFLRDQVPRVRDDAVGVTADAGDQEPVEAEHAAVGDPAAVGRPHRVDARARAVRDVAQRSAVRGHDPHLLRAGSCARKGDAAAVGRPRRPSLAEPSLRHRVQVAAVGVHHPDVPVRADRDSAAVTRPRGRLDIEARWRQLAHVGSGRRDDEHVLATQQQQVPVAARGRTGRGGRDHECQQKKRPQPQHRQAYPRQSVSNLLPGHGASQLESSISAGRSEGAGSASSSATRLSK